MKAVPEHGTRARYNARCRCDACRQANTEYARARLAAIARGERNHLVAARKARKHLLKLSRHGVGRDAVAAATDIALTQIRDIRNGKARMIRVQTERKILAVTTAMASDGALLPSAPAKALVNELLEEGYTEEFLAKQLGLQWPRVQISKRWITVRNAARISRLHEQLTA